MSVCVAIPSIPPRKQQLARAVTTVLAQTHPIDQLSVSIDHDRLGAAGNRNRAAFAASTEWVAFLDDDDEMDPTHIATLVRHAEATGADLVFPWHRIKKNDVEIGKDILPHRGISDEDIPKELRKANFIPVTVLVRTAALVAVGGFPTPGSQEWPHADCEDWGCWLRLLDAGFKISHIPEVTWTWHHWGWGKPGQEGNTSGMPTRW
jgi:GT2 family glycosyltransferase